MSLYKIMQSMSESGALKVNITDSNNQPIPDAKIAISFQGEPASDIETAYTDENGQTNDIILPAPAKALSEEAQPIMPYAEYTLKITSNNHNETVINGVNVFSKIKSIQNVKLDTQNIINISPNVLYGNYPAKIPELEIKPISNFSEIVLSEVVIPQSIVVHNGAPNDSTAQNYTVPFVDYIKNVACNEIYPTWPEATLRANILAILSFTLNRVYTEWYRGKGYYFTITALPAYDHKWTLGRNIFENVGIIVDEIFSDYLSRPNVKQPILAQYCDGKKTTCNGMSQWGSKALGDDGYDAIQILRRYYGSSLYINTAKEIEGVPMSWPGYILTIGDSGNNVRTIEEQLMAIKAAYPSIPDFEIDGVFDESTANAVKVFQKLFDLPQTGEVNYATWYKISYVYVAVEKIAT